MNSDESSWIKVDEANIFRNKPSELNFFVPFLTAQNYQIVLRTGYLAKDKSRKTIVETISDIITVMQSQ